MPTVKRHSNSGGANRLSYARPSGLERIFLSVAPSKRALSQNRQASVIKYYFELSDVSTFGTDLRLCWFRVSCSSLLHEGCDEPEILRYENLKSVPKVPTSDSWSCQQFHKLTHAPAAHSLCCRRYTPRKIAATHLILHNNPSLISLVHSYPVILSGA